MEEQGELPAWRSFRVDAVARYVRASLDSGSTIVLPVPPERPPVDVPTLGAWCRTWLARIKALETRGILREQTYLAYERVTRLHFGPLEDVPMNELRRPALLAWANAQIAAGASRKTLILRVAVLKVCLRDAMGDFDTLDANPAERLISSLRLPRSPVVQRWFDSTEAAGQFHAAAEGGPEWAGLALMLYTGLRIGEATGLRWEDVDLDGHRAVIRRQVSPKGKVSEPKTAAGTRTVDLPSVLVDVLRVERARQFQGRRSAWVLGIEPEHNGAGRNRLRKALARTLRKLGLPHLTPHGLRHSWISFRGLLGQDARLIQEQAGHSDPRMTAHYTHLHPSDPRAADEAADSIRPRQSRLFGGPKIVKETP
jgi:integrase